MPKKDSKTKKGKRGNAAEESVPKRGKGTRKQHTKDPMQDATRAGRKRAAGSEEGQETTADTDRPRCTGTKPNGDRCRRPPVRGGDRCQKHGGVAARTEAEKRAALKAALSRTEKVKCTAKKRNGDRCSNPPVKGTSVCRMHGAGAPQVKAKANQRLVEMVLPAMRELRKILDSKTATDSDKLRAVQMVLQRTGFNERHVIDIGLHEPSPFDNLMSTAFRIERGVENIIDPADEPDALPGGGGDEDVDDALTAMLDKRERDRATEASTRIRNDGHDVVNGEVLGDGRTYEPFGYPKSREQMEAESGRATEFDPEPHRRPGEPWRDYEAEVRRRVEERRR